MPTPPAATSAPAAPGPLPRYHRVYLQLRQRLQSGEFAPGQPMPGENALAAEYGVSRLTLRRSLEALEAEGLVTRRQGRGTYPAEPGAQTGLAAPQRSGDIDSLLAHLAGMGQQTAVRVLAVGRERAPAAVAAALGIAADEAVQKSVRVRSYDGQPFSHLTAYVPAPVADLYRPEDLATTPLLQLLTRHGVQLAGAEQAITAVLADIDTAAALDVQIGSPLLCIRRVVRDAAQRPVEVLHAVYRPDRYEYRMQLSAQSIAGSPVWTPVRTPGLS